MDVTNLTQFENIITDCSTPPPTADTTVAVDAFVQPVVRTFEDAIRFVGSLMECSPAARTVLKTALRARSPRASALRMLATAASTSTRIARSSISRACPSTWRPSTGH
jgi:hypothetical protein